MKFLFCLFVCLSFLNAELYKVYVKRVDSNLYRTSDEIFIKTKFCYHYTYGSETILKYDNYSYDNALIFDYDMTIPSKCDVKRIFK